MTNTIPDSQLLDLKEKYERVQATKKAMIDDGPQLTYDEYTNALYDFQDACERYPISTLVDEIVELRRDKRRLDWIEAHGNGDPWRARQSTTGRGYRVHNSSLGFAQLRDAIDGAIGEESLATDDAALQAGGKNDPRI